VVCRRTLEAPRCIPVLQREATIVADDYDDEGTLVVEQHFAIVPEWVIDTDISDAAYRLYSVLLRYGQSSGTRMPGRALLARRLRKRSTDSVDRALKELVAVGAVVVERRRRGREFLSNRYHLRSTPPARRSPEPNGPAGEPSSGPSSSDEPMSRSGGGRRPAATPKRTSGGRTSAATPGRMDAATLAADLRPYPGVPTQQEPPPPTPSGAPELGRPAGGGGGGATTISTGHPPAGTAQLVPVAAAAVAEVRREQLLAALGLESLDRVVMECRAARLRLGLPATRWTARVLSDVLAAAVFDHGWPAACAVPALLIVAADRDTRSPGRLACAGPWWDEAETCSRARLPTAAEAGELAWLEALLAEADGVRVRVQRLAREQLSAAGEPVTRLAVARLACRILRAEDAAEGVA
jgi:hypothetical protein